MKWWHGLVFLGLAVGGWFGIQALWALMLLWSASAVPVLPGTRRRDDPPGSEVP